MKAILVIDIPKDCEHCDCSFDDTDYGLFCSPLKRDVFSRNEKPSWCPLRPMPQKNEIKNEEEFMNVCGWMYEVQTGMDVGWNDCIDAIIGGTTDGTKGETE